MLCKTKGKGSVQQAQHEANAQALKLALKCFK